MKNSADKSSFQNRPLNAKIVPPRRHVDPEKHRPAEFDPRVSSGLTGTATISARYIGDSPWSRTRQENRTGSALLQYRCGWCGARDNGSDGRRADAGLDCTQNEVPAGSQVPVSRSSPRPRFAPEPLPGPLFAPLKQSKGTWNSECYW